MAQDLAFVLKAVNQASAALNAVRGDIDKLGDTAEKNSGKMGKMGGALGDMAKIAGGFVIAQGLLKLPGLLSGFVGGASALNESLSKVNVVFGANAKEIEAWASTAAKSLGMTKGAALEAAGTFGNFLSAMGATIPEATAMSKGMVQLATDLGSFNNADPTEVLLALRSGLSGEAEPMRKFGVAISAAAVNAKALEMGLKPLNGELTEQQKITARYAIIMEQTATAQGDFARTSGGLANQTKILKATFTDATTQLGTALLPGIVKLAGVMIQLLPVVVAFAQEFGGKLLTGIKEFAAVAWDKISGPLAALAALSWTGLIAGIDKIKELSGVVIDSSQFERLAAIDWGGLVSLTANANWAGWFATAAEKVGEFWNALRPMLEFEWELFKPLIDAVGTAFKDLGPALQELGEALAPLQPYLEPIAKILGGALLVAVVGITIPILLLAAALLGALYVALKTTEVAIYALAVAIPIVQGAFEAVAGFITETVVPAFTDAWQAVVDLWDKLMNFAAGVSGTLTTAAAPFIQFGKDAVAPIETIIGWIDSLIRKIKSIPSLPDITPGFSLPGIPGFAGGGRASGMALVGERGPELVSLPVGSYVHTAQQTARMLGIPGFAGGGSIDGRPAGIPDDWVFGEPGGWQPRFTGPGSGWVFGEPGGWQPQFGQPSVNPWDAPSYASGYQQGPWGDAANRGHSYVDMWGRFHYGTAPGDRNFDSILNTAEGMASSRIAPYGTMGPRNYGWDSPWSQRTYDAAGRAIGARESMFGEGSNALDQTYGVRTLGPDGRPGSGYWHQGQWNAFTGSLPGPAATNYGEQNEWRSQFGGGLQSANRERPIVVNIHGVLTADENAIREAVRKAAPILREEIDRQRKKTGIA